jgi:hypothetical protein
MKCHDTKIDDECSKNCSKNYQIFNLAFGMLVENLESKL